MKMHRGVRRGTFLPSKPRVENEPAPDGSVFGTHIPNDCVPFASGMANRYAGT